MTTVLSIVGMFITLWAAGFLYMASETNRYWNERKK